MSSMTRCRGCFVFFDPGGDLDPVAFLFAMGTQGQAVGRSRGGVATKILALSDTFGNLVGFDLWPGQRHDTVGVATLITGLPEAITEP